MEMSNEKYYNPDIGEICIGLEYERCDVESYTKLIVDELFSFRHFIKYSEEFRVKFLDIEDFESEGLVLNENETEHFQKKYCFYGNGGDDLVYFDANTSIIKMQKYIDKCSEPVFHGTIKNRSELRKVMEMIGITK